MAFHHNTNIISVTSLISGFLFTGITVLLFGGREIHGVQLQISLIFLTVLFDFSLWILSDHLAMGISLVDYVHADYARGALIRSFRMIIALVLFSISVPLLFLAAGMIWTTILSFGIVCVVIVLAYFITIVPFLENAEKLYRVSAREIISDWLKPKGGK